MVLLRSPKALPVTAFLAFALACGPDGAPEAEDAPGAAVALAPGEPSDMARHCTPGGGGITVAAGFCVIVVHEGVGRARHLDVAANGDVFVALRNGQGDDAEPGGVLVLRDSDGDGVADTEERWGENGGTEVLLDGDHVYFATNDAVLRYPIEAGSMAPSGPPDTLVAGLPDEGNHGSKSVAFGAGGALFVSIGSASNACQLEARTPGSPGKDPCDELDTRAGIWRFDAALTGQSFEDGTRHATGLRNVVALAADPVSGGLYGAVHGRDQLHTLFEEHFTELENNQNPAEEFVRITEGTDFGWPYCFQRYDTQTKVLAPEYGGDGAQVGRCSAMDAPLVSFPGHWAPNDVAFERGRQFPGPFQGAAFVAFHGSWNRTPTQHGYRVSAVPMTDGEPEGGWVDFATGFAGGQIESPRDAVFRPTGVAFGPDGSLYISDSVEGRIWRVVYQGAPAAP